MFRSTSYKYFLPLKKLLPPTNRLSPEFVQTRSFGSSDPCFSKCMKVAVLGAASHTGNCCSLLLKQSPLVDELALYDKASTYGLALELNYINTKCKVKVRHPSESCLDDALQDAKIVIIIADRANPNQSNPDLMLTSNAATLAEVLPSIQRSCPRALVAIAMHPINSLIPLATEIYKKLGVFEYNRLFGVTTVDGVRANSFFAETVGIAPECVMVPVVGGSSPKTCVPIFSQVEPSCCLSQEESTRLIYAVKMADEELFKKHGGRDSSCCVTAFAISRFCISLCKALRHQNGVVESAYVRSCVMPEVTYFAAPLELGPDGIQKHLGIPALNQYECNLLESAIMVLKKDIAHGQVLALGDKNASLEECPRYENSCGRMKN